MISNILFSSGNKGKLTEIKAIAARLLPGVTVLNPADLPEFGIPPEVPETERSYEGNARLKLNAYWQWCQGTYPVLVDDAGFEFHSFGGAPGVDTALYISKQNPSLKGAQGFLHDIAEVTELSKRRAKAVSILILRTGDVPDVVGLGTVEGTVMVDPCGSAGFGFDPWFVPDGFTTTFATQKASNNGCAANHRFRAFEHLVQQLRALKLIAT